MYVAVITVRPALPGFVIVCWYGYYWYSERLRMPVNCIP